MTIETNKENQKLILTLNGRLDSTTADDLSAVLERELTPDIQSLTLDVQNVDYISSKGLRVFVVAYRKLEGKEMILLSPNSSVLEVLRLSGLLKIFTVR